MPDVPQILITGANGQLGRSLAALKNQTPYKLCLVTRQEMDLSQPDTIDAFLSGKTFDFLINCAAYTAVDKAESDNDIADAVNHLAVQRLAEYAKQTGTPLIHISTDYVFDGQHFKPYQETDTPNPTGVYGRTKLAGEQAILALQPQALIIRTSWVYSEYGHNFVKTMLRLGAERPQLNVVFDQIGTPTYAGDLAAALLQIVGFLQQQPDFFETTGNVSLYHYSNEGVCSWYDLAQAIFQAQNFSCQLLAIESRDYPTPAQRPHYSVLNKHKIKQTFDLSIPYWRDSLQTCLTHLTSI
jgi:dTDP-4-dehydrorhamnose reductase